MGKSVFGGRQLGVATQHGKGEVIATVLVPALQLTRVFEIPTPTDVLGTFSGETERVLSPVEAAREKCRMAFEATGNSLIIASEGSFGPHPSNPFLTADTETLVLIDFDTSREYVVHHTSPKVHWYTQTFRSLQGFTDFLKQADFPRHGLLLHTGSKRANEIFKECRDVQQLEEKATFLLNQQGLFIAESDLRAFRNPTRMEVIGEAAQKLANLLQATCPNCTEPGFDVKRKIPGLNCAWCGMPSPLAKAYLKGCKACGFELEEAVPQKAADPQYCLFCNP
ncbi:MAG: hypothetical protein LCH37_07435 [Bacteroidetes bacterium]|nr:hypothetical protein [Bacteroidota bacterium]